MGKSGYTSLSLEEKFYARLRKDFDKDVNTDKTFTVWASDVLEAAVSRERQIFTMFPNLHFVGMTREGGCIIQDRKEPIEIILTKHDISCSVDKGFCNHCMFAVMHPDFRI